MIKKYFFFLSLVFFFSFLMSDRSLAVWSKSCASDQYSATQTCVGFVVEASNFGDIFDVRGQDDPFDHLNFFGRFSTNPTQEVDLLQGVSVQVPSSGYVEIHPTHTWAQQILPYTYSVETYARDQDAAQSAVSATYEITLRYAPIILTAQIGAATISPGATVSNGDVVTFTCSSTTNMTISPSPSAPTTFSVVNTGTYEYTGTFTNNDTVAHTYTVSCSNIGGSVNQKDFTFNTGTSGITGDIYISNVVGSPNTPSTPITFNWNSDGNACSLYNYDRSINFGSASGSPDPNRASVPWSLNLSAANAPSTNGTFRYYVKCLDSEYPGRQAGPSPIETFNGVTNEAWLPYDMNIGCPAGQEADVNGYCHIPCGAGLSWSPTLLQCVSSNGCPAGLFWKMFLGMYIAFLISFMCFFIHADGMDSRFGLSVGSIFAVIGNKYIIEASLPETASFTLVDMLHGVTLFFILLMIAANAYSLRLVKRDKIQKAIRFDNITAVIMLAIYLALNAWLIWQSYNAV